MIKLFLLCALVFYFVSRADDLDSASQEALGQTKSLMNSAADRQKYMNDHSDAKAADKKIDDLTSDPNTKGEVYKTSSDIYDDLVKKTGGDVEKQKEILDEASKDPEAFFNGLSPAQQQQIRDLAGKMQQEHPMNMDSRY
jgi:TRAP-type C4-dicarboxylate transport system substrate-binding protein